MSLEHVRHEYKIVRVHQNSVQLVCSKLAKPTKCKAILILGFQNPVCTKIKHISKNGKRARNNFTFDDAVKWEELIDPGNYYIKRASTNHICGSCTLPQHHKREYRSTIVRWKEKGHLRRNADLIGYTDTLLEMTSQDCPAGWREAHGIHRPATKKALTRVSRAMPAVLECVKNSSLISCIHFIYNPQ